MYNAYFNFKEAPFSIAPDPRYLYMTGQHREALAHLVYGLNSEGGCILLTGEVGTGKTTVCRCLLEQIPEHTNIALVVNPKVTATELLATICDELKIEYPAENNTIKTYIDRINHFLIDANARNEKTVLIIDEAQNLDDTVLEQLRLLTNLETNQRKLLQIIILGQPELLNILARQEMRQLAQRITARFHLNALSRNEVKAYINHRLAVAGQNARLFPDTTIAQLYRLSNGIPRLLNVICDRALLGTYVQNKPVVDTKTLSTAAKEVFGELKQVQNRSKLEKYIRLSAIISVAAIIIAVIAITLNDKFKSNSVASQSATETTITDEATIEKTAPQETIDPTLVEETVTENSIVAASTEVSATDSILSHILTSGEQSQELAFNALLQLWKPAYINKSGASICNDTGHGLRCLSDRGNFNSLRKLNRPAVLTLYNDNGSVSHIVLSHLTGNTATLYNGQETFDIETPLLEKYWYGEFSLLWQPPPFYQQPILPSSEGPVVQWLGQQMARISDHANRLTIYDVYVEELIVQVKAFQQSRGLIPDGIVGPLTLIHLNTAAGLAVPLLNQNKEGE